MTIFKQPFFSRERVDTKSNVAPFLNEGFGKRRECFGEKIYSEVDGKLVESGFKYDTEGACFLNR